MATATAFQPTDWRRVGLAGSPERCPRCGGRRCQVSPDGHRVRCWRPESKGGAGGRVVWIDPDKRPAPRPAGPDPAAAPPAAPDDRLDAAYRALLDVLPLETRHSHDLTRRKLTAVEREMIGAVSLPKDDDQRARAARAAAAAAPGAAVPGLSADGMRIRAAPGLLVPVRSVHGEIVGVRVRVDDRSRGGGKYRWLSGGRGRAKARCHVAFPPSMIATRAAGDSWTPSEPADRRVWVTEGEIKAQVAACRLDAVVVSLPGVSPPGRVVVEELVDAIEALGALTVVLALDADIATNPSVQLGEQRIIERLRKEGLTLERASWSTQDGKGLDDLLVAGHSPSIEPIVDATAAEEERPDGAGDAWEPPLSHGDEPLEYDRGAVVHALEQADRRSAAHEVAVCGTASGYMRRFKCSDDHVQLVPTHCHRATWCPRCADTEARHEAERVPRVLGERVVQVRMTSEAGSAELAITGLFDASRRVMPRLKPRRIAKVLRTGAATITGVGARISVDVFVAISEDEDERAIKRLLERALVPMDDAHAVEIGVAKLHTSTALVASEVYDGLRGVAGWTHDPELVDGVWKLLHARKRISCSESAERALREEKEADELAAPDANVTHCAHPECDAISALEHYTIDVSIAETDLPWRGAASAAIAAKRMYGFSRGWLKHDCVVYDGPAPAGVEWTIPRLMELERRKRHEWSLALLARAGP